MNEFKKAQPKLSRLCRILSNIIDSMPTMIIYGDHNARVNLMNAGVRKEPGKNPETAVEKKT